MDLHPYLYQLISALYLRSHQYGYLFTVSRFTVIFPRISGQSIQKIALAEQKSRSHFSTSVYLLGVKLQAVSKPQQRNEKKASPSVLTLCLIETKTKYGFFEKKMPLRPYGSCTLSVLRFLVHFLKMNLQHFTVMKKLVKLQLRIFWSDHNVLLIEFCHLTILFDLMNPLSIFLHL